MKRVEGAAFGVPEPTPIPRRLHDAVADGIRPPEGAAAFDRLLGRGLTGSVVVSPTDLEDVTAKLPPGAPVYTRPLPVGSGDGFGAVDETEAFLMEAWADLLGVEGVRPDDNFFELGGHSLLAVRLFHRIARSLGKTLGLAVLFEAPTPRQLASLLRDGPPTPSAAPSSAAPSSAASSRRYLVPIETGDADRLPFFCVHGAGGNVLNFRELARRIGGDQPFYGLQARGVDGVGQPHRSIPAMAAAYLEEVRAVQPAGPYLLGGYSGGGVVAFEMAHQLRLQGEEVGALLLLDTFRPDLPPSPHPRWDLLYELISNPADLLRNLRAWSDRRTAYRHWRERKEELDDYLAKGLPLPLPLREIQLTEAYHAAVEGYELRPYPGPGVLFTAVERAPTLRHLRPDLGWGELIGGDFRVLRVPGDHDSLVRKPNVSALARTVRLCLDQAQRRGRLSPVTSRMPLVLPSLSSSPTTS